MGAPRGGALRAGRIAVPERRRQADRPVDGARRRAGRPPASAAAEHHPLDQVDRDRESRSPARAPDSRTTWRSATTSRSTASRFLHDCHEFVFHFTPRRRHAARSAGDRRPLSGSVERRPLARRRRPASAAAATPGSFRTRPSRTARRTGRIRRPSRRGCRRCACGCTASSASASVADPFLGLGSTAVACAQLGVELHRDRDGRGLPEGSDRATRARRRTRRL